MRFIYFILIALILISSLFIYGCSSDSTSAKAIVDEPACSKGIVNDSYPGSCSSYIDENNNGICDLSE
jgi:hypothetical protein